MSSLVWYEEGRIGFEKDTNMVKEKAKAWVHWFAYGDMHPGTTDLPKHPYKKVIFYRLLGMATIIYFVMHLLVFYDMADSLQHNLVWIWMTTVLMYTIWKDAYKFYNIPSPMHWGEFFAWLIIAGFGWMTMVNFYNNIFYGLPYHDYPEGYTESTAESILLLLGSYLFQMRLYAQNKKNGLPNNNTNI